MMQKLVSACLAASSLLLAAVPANAALVVHDFDDLAAGPQASITIGPVTYTAFGAPVSSTTGTHSTPNGTPGLISFTEAFPGAPRYYSPIVATIAGGTNFVSIELGSFGGPPIALFLTAYDMDGQYIGYSYYIPDNLTLTLTTLSFSAPNIGSVAFGNQYSDGVIADNFTFQVAGGVPEPASWAMMIAGFGLVGAAMRRRPSTNRLPEGA